MRALLVAALCVAACTTPAPPSADDEGDVAASASEAEASTDADADAEASTDEGTSFVGPTPDLAQHCVDKCTTWDQTTCPADKKCAAVSCEVGSSAWDTNGCVDVLGDKQLGETCSMLGVGLDGLDDCAPGLLCWDVDAETGLDHCLAYCTGSYANPVCPPDHRCAVGGDGTLAPCIPLCDPIAQDCWSDKLCLPASDGEGYVCVAPSSSMPGTYGSPCEFVNACDPGLLCLEASVVPEPTCDGALGCCTPYCDLSSPNTCPGAGQVCEPFFDPQPAGYENVGVCAVPQP